MIIHNIRFHCSTKRSWAGGGNVGGGLIFAALIENFLSHKKIKHYIVHYTVQSKY